MKQFHWLKCFEQQDYSVGISTSRCIHRSVYPPRIHHLLQNKILHYFLRLQSGKIEIRNPKIPHYQKPYSTSSAMVGEQGERSLTEIVIMQRKDNKFIEGCWKMYLVFPIRNQNNKIRDSAYAVSLHMYMFVCTFLVTQKFIIRILNYFLITTNIY